MPVGLKAKCENKINLKTITKRIMELSVKKIGNVYRLLNEAKMGKMESKDQIKLVRIVRKLKGVMAPFDDFVKDAQEKLKGENHDEVVRKWQQWQREGEETTLSEEERSTVAEYMTEYNKKLNECLKEEFEREHEVEFEKIDEAAFEKLIASNDWPVYEIVLVEELIVA